MSKISPGAVGAINKPRIEAGQAPIDFGQDPLTGGFNFGAGSTEQASEQGGGVSLAGALLSLSVEEDRPALGGGLSLFAMQDRRLNRVEIRVAKLEQEA